MVTRFYPITILFVRVCLILFMPVAAGAGPFHYSIIARTGQAGLTGFGTGPSVNDSGSVAWMGKLTGGQGIFVGDGATFANLTPGYVSSNQFFGDEVQINNASPARVISFMRIPAQGGSGAKSYILSWDTTSTDAYTQIVSGGSAINAKFSAVFNSPSLNSSGQSAFSAFDVNSSPTRRYLVTPSSYALTASPAFFAKALTTLPIYPMIADNGTIIVRAGSTSTSPIRLYQDAQTLGGALTLTDIATSSNFKSLGAKPGISRNGNIIAFYGDIDAAHASLLNVTPGPGIFVSVKTPQGWILKRVAGTFHQGALNPGDRFPDRSKNGQFDPAVRRPKSDSPISTIYPDERVGVGNAGNVVFLAADNLGRKTLFCSFVDYDTQTTSWSYTQSTPLPAITVYAPTPVAGVGGTLPGLSGNLTDITINDPVNGNAIPDIAFVATTQGGSAVVRATGCPISAYDGAYPFPTRQQPDSISGNGWRMQAYISDAEGLTLEDIWLQKRYMAQRLSLPLGFLETDLTGIPRHCLLQPNNAGAFPMGCRLVNYHVDSVDANGEVKTVVSAAYLINHISPGSDSALLVAQQYEFHQYDPEDHLTPRVGSNYVSSIINPALITSGNRFKPIVRYRFLADSRKNEHLVTFNSLQRLHFVPDGMSANYTAPFFDAANLQLTPPFIQVVVGPFGNPINAELSVNCIKDGQTPIYFGLSVGSIFADNLHQTWMTSIQPPEVIPLPAPGCPECVHIHWRWAKVGGAPDPLFVTNGGNPLIPANSNQDVSVAFVRNRNNALLEHAALLNQSQTPLPTGQQDWVTWYSATGKQTRDAFFLHGGFYLPTFHFEVTPLISIVKLPFKYDPKARTWNQDIQIRNISRSTINGRISLEINRLGDIQLLNGDNPPSETPYYLVDLGPSKELAPGDVRVATLKWDNKGGYAVSVYAGVR